MGDGVWNFYLLKKKPNKLNQMKQLPFPSQPVPWLLFILLYLRTQHHARRGEKCHRYYVMIITVFSAAWSI